MTMSESGVRVDAARLRADFHDGLPADVVDDQLALFVILLRLEELLRVALLREALLDVAQIHARLRREQAQHQILARHFETEHEHRARRRSRGFALSVE